MKNAILIHNISALCIASILYFTPITVNIYELSDINLLFRIAMGGIGGLSLIDVFIKRKELFTGILLLEFL